MIDTRFAETLREGEPLLGLFVGIPGPALVEMAGYAGFDFVVIDNEHGPAGIETTEQLIRAAECAGVTPIVRVSAAKPEEILRTLDVGAVGVHVPQVNTAAEASAVVEAVKYPPQGGRGLALSTRAAGWGFHAADHVRRSDEQTVVVTHLETVDAVENLDALLEVEGLDVLYMGPTDLSASMGYPGNTGHPEVRQTIAKCLERIAASEVVPGIAVADAVQFKEMAELGARYMAIGTTTLVGEAMKQAVAMVKGTG